MKRTFVLMVAALGLAACESPRGKVVDKTIDYGYDRKNLSELQAGIWIDPEGCHHWMVDDGLEGYLSQRLNPDGTPVCTPLVEGSVAIGGFKTGSEFGDLF